MYVARSLDDRPLFEPQTHLGGGMDTLVYAVLGGLAVLGLGAGYGVYRLAGGAKNRGRALALGAGALVGAPVGYVWYTTRYRPRKALAQQQPPAPAPAASAPVVQAR